MQTDGNHPRTVHCLAWLVTTRAHARVAMLIIAMSAGCEAVPLGLGDGSATLRVTVVRGPVQPVQREGALGWEPVPGARIGVRPTVGDVTRHVATDTWGTARLRVAAGGWIVSVETCPGALSPPPAQTIDVQAGTFVMIRFECDTGIR